MTALTAIVPTPSVAAPTAGLASGPSLARVGAPLLALLLALICWASPARARMPAEFAAIVVSASPGETQRVFDLRPAIEQAQRAGRPILMYFGAHDCPYCQQLMRAFGQQATRLGPKLRAKFTLIEIDGWLRGPRALFLLADGEYTLAQLRERIGDTHKRFVWPSFFHLDRVTLKTVRELPQGNNDYLQAEVAELVLDL